MKDVLLVKSCFFSLFMKGTTIGRMAYLWEKCEIAEISLIKGAGYY